MDYEYSYEAQLHLFMSRLHQDIDVVRAMNTRKRLMFFKMELDVIKQEVKNSTIDD